MKIKVSDLNDDIQFFLDEYVENPPEYVNTKTINLDKFDIEDIKANLDKSRGVEHAKDVDLDQPLIVWSGKLIDGFHRIYKGLKNGEESLEAIELSDYTVDAPPEHQYVYESFVGSIMTISESIQIDSLEAEFMNFVNEASPASYKPSDEKIKSSIKKRKYVGIYYEEEGGKGKVLSGFRLIEPLVFGRGYKHANGIVTHKRDLYLRAYVIKESQKDRNKQLHKVRRKSVSKSERVPYFRLFKYNRITMWSELRFTITKPREDYNPKDKMIAKILQSIKFK